MKDKIIKSKIAIPLLKSDFHITPIADVKYLESNGSVCYIMLQSDLKLTSIKALKHYHNILIPEHQFFQFSQSLIVNLDYLLRFNTTSKEITLQCGKVLKMSRSGAQAFKQKLEKDGYRL